MNDQQNLMIKVVLDNWYSSVKRSDAIFNSLTDEQLLHEAAPGRNRGAYLMGHLTAVHDAMLPLLGLGESLHPELLEPYVKNADSKTDNHTLQQLRQYWSEVNEAVANKFNALTADEWLQKHTSVSAEDFAKEPHRNRLNVLLSRFGHLEYHRGQVAFLKEKAD